MVCSLTVLSLFALVFLLLKPSNWSHRFTFSLIFLNKLCNDFVQILASYSLFRVMRCFGECRATTEFCEFYALILSLSSSEVAAFTSPPVLPSPPSIIMSASVFRDSDLTSAVPPLPDINTHLIAWRFADGLQSAKFICGKPNIKILHVCGTTYPIMLPADCYLLLF